MSLLDQFMMKFLGVCFFVDDIILVDETRSGVVPNLKFGGML
jgi:hypothetical protein